MDRQWILRQHKGRDNCQCSLIKAKSIQVGEYFPTVTVCTDFKAL